MVCKEEILTWFKDLDSHRRIDMLCELINMCMPFELRFVGSYIEEMGKHSYQELRQQALAANDVEKLEKDPALKNQSLYDESVRHRMLINVSLLKSRNYNAANWYSKKFLRTSYVHDLIVKEKDELVQNELFLLYTMAARHPAFSFEQKEFYNTILVQLYDLRDSQLNKTCSYRYPPGFEFQTYRNMKVQDGTTPFQMGFATHAPGLPQYLEWMSPHYRTGWPGVACGAPPEVPPFPHQPPMQPPQPPTSPLVSSPSQSRSGSPRPVSRPPPFSIITSAAPTVTIPTGNPAAIVAVAPGIPAPAAPVASVLPTIIPVPIEVPPPLNPASQPSPVYGPVKQLENEDLSVTLKEEPTSKPPLLPLNPWLGPNDKQINGLRIGAGFTPVRASISDQIQSMTLTDESSHYHSSSSSSPLQTPPDTPSNVIPTSTAPVHRTGTLEKNRVNGLPGFMPPYGSDTTSPPPPPAFPFNAAFGPIIPPRFYTNPGFRPPVTTVLTQYPPGPTPPSQPYQQQGGQSVESTATPHTYTAYSLPYIHFMYSSFMPPQQTPPPPNPVPPRNHPPGCYNCGATGHLGQDCPQQNIDDITQKNTYRFPTDPEKCREWFAAMGLDEDRILAKNLEICSDYFNPDDIITRANDLEYIIRGAKPTPHANIFFQESSTSSVAFLNELNNLPSNEQTCALPSTSASYGVDFSPGNSDTEK